jgi:hypothetical protein
MRVYGFASMALSLIDQKYMKEKCIKYEDSRDVCFKLLFLDFF